MPSSSFALGALGALGCVFLEPVAVSADANTKPREVRARALGGMGGDSARATLSRNIQALPK